MKKNIIRALTAALLLSATAASAEDIAAVASQEWRSYVDPLAAIGEKMVPRMQNPQDPQLRHELYRALFSQMAVAYLGVLYADPQYPDFYPWFNSTFNNLGPNPDNVYYLTPIDDDGVYKISGVRGTVKMVDFQIGTGTFIPRGTFDDPVFSVTLANYDLDTLPLNKDGSFEVVLSATRPQGYKGNWWKLYPKSTYINVRQTSYDWLHEVDARLAIERLDRPPVKPRPDTVELDASLKQVAKWVETNLKFSFDYLEWVRKTLNFAPNKVDYLNLTEYGGHITQKYSGGSFDLEPDEALIVEFGKPERCRYWSIHLIDDIFLSLDWMNRQTSLNGYTAKVNKDGKFRVVISSRDPGVPNWLDTAGYKTGGIQGRWKECSSWPDYKTIKVKTVDIRNYLPADTPVVTVEERDAAIRLRRKAVQLRRRW